MLLDIAHIVSKVGGDRTSKASILWTYSPISSAETYEVIKCIAHCSFTNFDRSSSIFGKLAKENKKPLSHSYRTATGPVFVLKISTYL